MNVLKHLLLENLGVKLVALLLAVALYLHIYTERPASMTLTFPLQITDVADSLSLTGAAPEPIRAELRGNGKQLIRLRLTEPHIRVSLAGVGPGRYERTVVAEDLPLLGEEGLEVVRLITPRLISLEIDHRIERVVPVSVRTLGRPHWDWTWGGRFVADPPTVVVTGPRHEVSRIDSVRLHTIRVEGKSDTVKAIVHPDSLPRWCTAEPGRIRVSIVLERLPRP